MSTEKREDAALTSLRELVETRELLRQAHDSAHGQGVDVEDLRALSDRINAAWEAARAILAARPAPPVEAAPLTMSMFASKTDLAAAAAKRLSPDVRRLIDEAFSSPRSTLLARAGWREDLVIALEAAARPAPMPPSSTALDVHPAAASAEAVLRPADEVRANAERYRWLREQIKAEPTRVAAQALFWNFNSRTQLDAAVDEAIRAERDSISPEALEPDGQSKGPPQVSESPEEKP